MPSEFSTARLASTTPVRDYMTATPAFIYNDETIQAAAQKMALRMHSTDFEPDVISSVSLQHNIGFLPVADREKNIVTGVVTDRDITIRAVANGIATSGKARKPGPLCVLLH